MLQGIHECNYKLAKSSSTRGSQWAAGFCEKSVVPVYVLSLHYGIPKVHTLGYQKAKDTQIA